jgi:hypothetical protein
MKISHAIVGMILFGTLFTLILNFHDGVKNTYVPACDKTIFDASSSDEISNKNIGERLRDINFIQGVRNIVDGLKAIKGGNLADIAGGLLKALDGFIRSILGVFTSLVEVSLILEEHYAWIPSGFTLGLLCIFTIYLVIAYKQSTSQQGGL